MRSDLSLGATGDGELPNITGSIAPNSNIDCSGCFYESGTASSNGYGSHVYAHKNIIFDASRSSSAYSRTDNYVLPRYLATTYVIKY